MGDRGIAILVQFFRVGPDGAWHEDESLETRVDGKLRCEAHVDADYFSFDDIVQAIDVDGSPYGFDSGDQFRLGDFLTTGERIIQRNGLMWHFENPGAEPNQLRVAEIGDHAGYYIPLQDSPERS